MLNLKLIFSHIDYEKTLLALFPRLLSALNRIDSTAFPIRLLQRVGEKSERALLDILARLSDAQKNEIVIAAFRLERERIIKNLTDVLHQNEYGRHIDFADAFMAHDENGQIELYLQDVSIDYYSILRRMVPLKQVDQPSSSEESSLHSVRRFGLRTADYAARAAGTLMNWGAGDKVLSSFIKREENVRLVADALENTLLQNGIHAQINHCIFLPPKESIPPQVIFLHQDASIPSELIDSLLDTLSAYIIELIDRRQ